MGPAQAVEVHEDPLRVLDLMHRLPGLILRLLEPEGGRAYQHVGVGGQYVPSLEEGDVPGPAAEIRLRSNERQIGSDLDLDHPLEGQTAVGLPKDEVRVGELGLGQLRDPRQVRPGRPEVGLAIAKDELLVLIGDAIAVKCFRHTFEDIGGAFSERARLSQANERSRVSAPG